MNEKEFSKMVSGLVKTKLKDREIKEKTHSFFKVWALVYFVLLIGWIIFK